MRITLTALVVCAISASGFAQTAGNPVRIRITGVSTYEIPGVIAIQADQLRAGQADQIRGPADIDDHFVRFTPAGSGVQISLLRPGRQIEGGAYSLNNGTLQFLPDGYRDVSDIPVNSLERIEQRRPRVRRAVGAALRVLGAITAICITLAGPLGMCDDSEDQMGRCATRYFLAITTIPPAAAIVAVARDRWTRLSVAELETALRTANRRIQP